MIKSHLFRLLGERRWSQARLARETGIRPSTICAYYNEFADRISFCLLYTSAKRFFNPKYDYKVYLTYMGTTYWLAAELAAFKAPNDQIDQPQTWSCLLYTSRCV